MLFQLITSTTEFVTNQIIDLDPEARKRLKSFCGKTIAVHIEKIAVDFYVLFGDEAIYIQTEKPEHIDVSIAGPLSSFLIMAYQGNESLPKNLKISGNIDLLQRLSKNFAAYELDWENFLAKIFGDKITFYLAKFLKNIYHNVQKSRESMRENIKEYLQEELQLLVNRYAIEDLCNEIDILRDDVERMAIRMQRLSSLNNQGEI